MGLYDYDYNRNQASGYDCDCSPYRVKVPDIVSYVEPDPLFSNSAARFWESVASDKRLGDCVNAWGHSGALQVANNIPGFGCDFSQQGYGEYGGSQQQGGLPYRQAFGAQPASVQNNFYPAVPPAYTMTSNAGGLAVAANAPVKDETPEQLKERLRIYDEKQAILDDRAKKAAEDKAAKDKVEAEAKDKVEKEKAAEKAAKDPYHGLNNQQTLKKVMESKEFLTYLQDAVAGEEESWFLDNKINSKKLAQLTEQYMNDHHIEGHEFKKTDYTSVCGQFVREHKDETSNFSWKKFLLGGAVVAGALAAIPASVFVIPALVAGSAIATAAATFGISGLASCAIFKDDREISEGDVDAMVDKAPASDDSHKETKKH